jgi:hypothetical protein
MLSTEGPLGVPGRQGLTIIDRGRVVADWRHLWRSSRPRRIRHLRKAMEAAHQTYLHDEFVSVSSIEFRLVNLIRPSGTLYNRLVT